MRFFPGENARMKCLLDNDYPGLRLRYSFDTEANPILRRIALAITRNGRN